MPEDTHRMYAHTTSTLTHTVSTHTHTVSTHTDLSLLPPSYEILTANTSRARARLRAGVTCAHEQEK